MAGTGQVQSPLLRRAALRWATADTSVVLSFAAVVYFVAPQPPGNGEVVATGVATFLFWLVSAARRLELRACPRDILAALYLCWRLIHTFGCAMVLAHVVIAFEVAHGWSHRAAYEHVERVGGFGPGLYANYL